MDRQVAIDGGLAAIVLLVTAAVAVLGAVDISMVGVTAGTGAAILFEWMVRPHSESIRVVWERPAVRLVSLGLACALVLVLASVASSFGLSFVGGAAGAYLVLLGLLKFGLVAPPGR